MTNNVVFNSISGKSGNVGEIVLNRENKLNSLSHEMLKEMQQQLLQWQNDKKIKAVIIKSNSDRAFCAGGDLRLFYDKHKIPRDLIEYFRTEYQVNSLIHHFPKPFIALLDGITMGGGVGVSAYGSHRVATENVTFAMPETAIGFFPDVGASYILSRCPGKIGLYLALTGQRIKTNDLFAIKIANAIIKHAQLDDLQKAIVNTKFAANEFDVVSEVIAEFHTDMNHSELLANREIIDECFQHNSMQKIIDALQQSNDWGKKTAEHLLRQSPTSLVITLEQQHRAIDKDFDTIIQTDFNLVHNFIQDHDFIEGIRAMIIDKDKQPHWQPDSLNVIHTDVIKNYFQLKESL